MTNHETIETADLARFIAEKTHHNLFLTGKAGTGKTVFLRDFVEHTKKKVVVLAPTGIAAINANAMTIHSFCHFNPAPCPLGRVKEGGDFLLDEDEEELVKNLDMIIIDEVSMVRADVMDHISEKIRLIRNSKEPFGGVQLLLIGDLYQLPPVTTKSAADKLKDCYGTNFFFFNSVAIKKVGFETVCLNKVYRQDNPEFVNILNKARVGDVSWTDCNKLNERYEPDFETPDKLKYITLVAQKIQAEVINNAGLDSMDGDSKTYDAVVTGDFPKESYPTYDKLSLKKGAQVMFIKNDKLNRYCNGTIGEVVELDENRISVKVGEGTVDVMKDEWKNIRYEYSAENSRVQSKIIGTFTQFPLKPAWAITIHKSQGLSFDNAIINIPRAFAAGQAYVALSRCRSLEGLVLKKKFHPDSFFTDPLVSSFYAGVDNAIHIAKLAKAVGYEPFEWDNGNEQGKESRQESHFELPYNKDDISKMVKKVIYEVDYPIYHLSLEFGMEIGEIVSEIREWTKSYCYGYIESPYYRMKFYKEVYKKVRKIVYQQYYNDRWSLID